MPCSCENLERQVDREAVGVVQLECVGAGQHPCRRNAAIMSFRIARPLSMVLSKLASSFSDDLVDIILLLDQLGISAAGFSLITVSADVGQERLVDAEQLAVTSGAAQQAAQNVAAALIGRA